MARPLYLSPARIALLALAMGGPVGVACTSDDLIALTDVDPSTTYVDPTEVAVFTTGEPEDTGTTGPPMMGTDTCREALNCVVNCAIDLPLNPPPEQDYSCFLPCIDDLVTEEWLALIDHATCMYTFCQDTMQCPDADPEKPTCTACLIFSLSNDPMGCEMSGKACK